jgi:hypothetical protein
MSGDSFVSWLPQYSLNIEAIDQQHQVLVMLLRQLQEAMWEGRGQAFQKNPASPVGGLHPRALQL